MIPKDSSESKYYYESLARMEAQLQEYKEFLEFMRTESERTASQALAKPTEAQQEKSKN